MNRPSLRSASPRKKREPRGHDYLAVADTIQLVSDIERSVVDPEPTFLKIIIGTHSRNLLGCLAVEDHAAVTVNIGAIAMNSGLTIEQLRQMPLIPVPRRL